GGALVTSDRTSRSAAVVPSSTARLTASSSAFDASFVPLSLRTNCSAEARISSSVAGGRNFASVLMLRHMGLANLPVDEVHNLTAAPPEHAEPQARPVRVAVRHHDQATEIPVTLLDPETSL